MNIHLTFDAGTLLLPSECEEMARTLPGFQFDSRTKNWRAPAHCYREIVIAALKNGWKVNDQARQYQAKEFDLLKEIVPREHQAIALNSWRQAHSRGVISLPTGAGKTILAVMAIKATSRPTLVVVPTIDLLGQWQQTLSNFFGESIGLLGGGNKSIDAITVATYDSAALFAEKIGNRFGLLVFDECHHLPAAQYQFIAKASLAPFRLGLSATVERTDGGESLLFDLVGPLVHRGEIREMLDNVLSPYEIVSVQIPLSEEEKVSYDKARSIYTSFIKRFRINFSSGSGWSDFIKLSATMPGGREAWEAYRLQKNLAQCASGKLDELWRILVRHHGERIIVFTQDNAMAYQIGRRFILPVLTHQTKSKERKKMLEGFRNGSLDVLVTSKVLNEGVDVPEASVGVVISGSGAVREHVQRLGRILRHREGKTARLYEVISKDTNEYYVNQRRRNHNAYQEPSEIQRSWR